MILNYLGRDSWDRPVYESEGEHYVDIDPFSFCQPNICTKANNEFDGEPDMPVKEETQFLFIPKRDVWR